MQEVNTHNFTFWSFSLFLLVQSSGDKMKRSSSSFTLTGIYWYMSCYVSPTAKRNNFLAETSRNPSQYSQQFPIMCSSTLYNTWITTSWQKIKWIKGGGCEKQKHPLPKNWHQIIKNNNNNRYLRSKNTFTRPKKSIIIIPLAFSLIQHTHP